MSVEEQAGVLSTKAVGPVGDSYTAGIQSTVLLSCEWTLIEQTIPCAAYGKALLPRANGLLTFNVTGSNLLHSVVLRNVTRNGPTQPREDTNYLCHLFHAILLCASLRFMLSTMPLQVISV